MDTVTTGFPAGDLPPVRLPAARLGILAPVVAALLIGLAAVAVHASGQPSWHHGFVSSGPNFAPLVPILVVVASSWAWPSPGTVGPLGQVRPGRACTAGGCRAPCTSSLR